MDTATQRIETGTGPGGLSMRPGRGAGAPRARHAGARSPDSLADRGAKRALDVFVAGALLLVLSPLIAVASVLIVSTRPAAPSSAATAPASGAAACRCSSSARCGTAPVDAR